MLNKAEIREGVFDNAEIIQNMLKHSNDFIFLITNHSNLSFKDIIIERAQSGIKVKFIYSDKSTIPAEYKENENIELRVMGGINFVASFTGSQAVIVPPTTDGRMNYQKILFGTNKQFTDWALHLFEHYYLRAVRV
jgi:predicted transcriptional regulator